MDESTGLSLLRSALMLLSSTVAGSGYATGEQWTAIVAGLIAVLTVGWNWYSHKSVVAKLVAARVKLGIIAPS